ncbi:Major facilitator superfamily domain-containing protein 10 OS=Homo sapiens GN=MFSD10 PE=2 SV=1 [Rhizoctonia solani AG-1 IB]|uniref:Major facilitator superfamily domain-containing protein 10 n=1 Tax=Thanatephorus cucumeris (strain AG1-IB / isolate 7/3/14) TaxID=1108050 RepID=A0A0B7G0K1_THACB|nr:Major facilitator superfamily domain-containing protein 10 OS=Homo sapiens GN=MFSD10 PE=2 SV=1 [Rhizoctonia solani AG-1 IB]
MSSAMTLEKRKWIQKVVVLALILDLFAFTIPLPLFPRLIDWYTRNESDGALLAVILRRINRLRQKIAPHAVQRKWDVVLLGGLMGSLFSSLQFFISPYIGSLSDKYGRKRVLLASMVGNILSAIVWIQSTSFASFLLARAIGGISEGNVQLSIAMLSDITPPARRSAALMFIGIAFSICFTIGPPIGAYFSIHPFPLSFTRDMNIYATPAILTLVLLLIETAFLAAYLPETRGAALIEEEGDETVRDRYKKLPLGERRALLKRLGGLHFSFLSLFSGVEFTLTFLTFDLLDWNNSQNGRLLGLIGVFSALLQGGYVRRATSKVGESAFARRGMVSCAAAMIILSMVPHMVRGVGGNKVTSTDIRTAVGLLHAAAALLSFTSATVVTSLTALASLQCDEEISAKNTLSTTSTSPSHTEPEKLAKTGVTETVSASGVSVHPRLTSPTSKGRATPTITSRNIPSLTSPVYPQSAHNNITPVNNPNKISTGRALGEFRSSGQLGRAIGPLLACIAYWTVGPSVTYSATAIAMCALIWRTGIVMSSLRRADGRS